MKLYQFLKYGVYCLAFAMASCGDKSLSIFEEPKQAALYSALPYGRDVLRYTSIGKDTVVSIFSTASPEDVSWFWKEKLSYELEKGKFTPEQQSVIKKGIELASPAFFSNRSDSLQKGLHAAFMKEAKANFNPSTGYALFASHRLFANEKAAFESLTQADLEQKIIYKGTEVLNCNCNTVYDWCISGNSCEGICNLSTRTGCGTFMAFHCQGSCK